MEKFTLITLLAKTSQPVLAHHCLFSFGMSKWTQRPSITNVPHKIFTYSCTRLCVNKEVEGENKATTGKTCHLNPKIDDL